MNTAVASPSMTTLATNHFLCELSISISFFAKSIVRISFRESVFPRMLTLGRTAGLH